MGETHKRQKIKIKWGNNIEIENQKWERHISDKTGRQKMKMKSGRNTKKAKVGDAHKKTQNTKRTNLGAK